MQPVTNQKTEQELKFDELVQLIRNNHLEEFRSQLALDNNIVNFQDVDGFTLLHWACFSGNLQAVDILLQNGAQVNVQINRGCTPIHKAISSITFADNKDSIATRKKQLALLLNCYSLVGQISICWITFVVHPYTLRTTMVGIKK